ncbi:M3 family metallopeptidase [Vaginella massiliensis]|uniref:M3 family metallopeptidase n=1 Tax=Vaginella massiliensis TaxID=1816680 RepID=UPI0008385200
MKRIIYTLGMASMLIGYSCNSSSVMSEQNTTEKLDPKYSNNPFFVKSSLQYQAPEFDKIKNEHYKPAFDFGLAQQLKEIEAILANNDKPTFENTVLALENSGEVLGRAQIVFYNLASANTNDEIQKLQREYAPIFAAHRDKIYLNEALYKRFKQVETSKLDAESKRLVEYYLQNFEIAGANLNADQKSRLKTINQELASLSTEFSSKLLKAREEGAVVFDHIADLDGLSSDEIAAAKADAEAAGFKGKYLLNLQNTTQQPALQSLTNRKSREKLFKASWQRAEKGDANDTRATIDKIAKLRLEKAQLFGKRNFAEWKLQDQMAKTPEAAFELMQQLAKPAIETAKVEAKEIQSLIDKQKGNFKLEPWDWNFYAEQVRKAKYDLDENEIKPYFELNNVLEKGVFYAAEKFYGLTFKKRTDLPVYHPDVMVYEVFDRDGSSLALYYLDFYTRNNKGGGAWMNNFVEQSHNLNQKPVITNVYNYQKPAAGKPTLLTFDEVITTFHEFGHTLHGLFADQKYKSLSGTNVPRDFVEFPSQINEHFALVPEVLANYALHYETKKPMPNALVEKIKKAANFNQGYYTSELVAAAMLDMTYHTVTSADELIPVLEFEKNALNRSGLNMKEVPPRYHSPYFAHVWGGGYSAGYYAYIWSETLDSDAWEWIEANGGMTRKNGDRFRAYILSIGNAKDLNKAFEDFTGRKPSIDPLLRRRGFKK